MSDDPIPNKEPAAPPPQAPDLHANGGADAPDPADGAPIDSIGRRNPGLAHPAFVKQRWAPGRSGNTKGRPRGPSIMEIMDRVLAEEVEARVDGKTVRITAAEVLARRLVKRMMDGDARAFEAYLSRREPMLRRVEIVTQGADNGGTLIRVPIGGLADLGAEKGDSNGEAAE